jgi:hypothetical protein
MAGESIALGPRQHGKLGKIHCGVAREGQVSVAGEVKNINDGETVTMARTGITVSRNGEEYTFSKSAA